MAKKDPSRKKKKGPKGKRAREKAKLNRQWGEHQADPNEGRRRRGKSRLLPDSRQVSTEGHGSTFNDPTFPKDDEPNDTIDGTVDDPLSGLLRSIHKSVRHGQKNRSRSQQRNGLGNQDGDDDTDDFDNDGASESHSRDTERSEIAQDDMDVLIKDDEEDEEPDDDDDDDGSNHNGGPRQIDLFGSFFGYVPSEKLDVDDKKSFKVTLNDDLQYQLAAYSSQNDEFLQQFQSGNKDPTADEWKQLCKQAFACDRKLLQKRWQKLYKNGMTLSQCQSYPFLARYMDMLLTENEHNKAERTQMHRMVMLHMTNHVLTSRGRISRNDKRIRDADRIDSVDGDDASNNDREASIEEVDNIRDQGFTRPTVLVMLPTRGLCYRFVKQMVALSGVQMNKEYEERFEAEYGVVEEDDDDDVQMAEAGMDVKEREQWKRLKERRKRLLQEKPKSWRELFNDDVNQDDDFKMGIALTPCAAADARKGRKNKNDKNRTGGKSKSKVSMRLYTDFFRSDIIVASPIGLKMMVAPDDEDDEIGDADFLSSIEICYLGHADVLMMQNWDHVNDILALMNKQPTKNNDTDFSRVRNYLLDDQASTRRQLVVSTKVVDPCILSAFKQHAKSIAGSVVTRVRVAPEDAAIANVVLPVRQVFQKVNAAGLLQKSDARLSYFLGTLLPQIQRLKQKHTLIYIPSYFDFCSVRNALLKRDIEFVSVTEYSRATEVTRGRARFLQGRKPIMLYTGRCHFFRRHAIKAARHLIFFGLPEHPEFYAEHVNRLQTKVISAGNEPGEEMETTTSCLSLFTKYDAHALERIVGTSNCKKMMSSQKSTFMFYS